MANQQHVDTLRSSREQWNKWRQDHPELKPDLKEANLQGLDLRWYDLSEADLFNANLTKADMRHAKLNKADLNRATLVDVRLLRGSFNDANLADANFSGADLRDCIFHRANLFKTCFARADLSRSDICEGKFYKTDLSKTKLSGANLMKADLRSISKLRLDETYIRDARFAPNCSDPWSVLRRSYTGTNFAFGFVALLAFVLPYMANASFWRGVNLAQEALVSNSTELSRRAQPLTEGAQSGALPDLSNLTRCFSKTCEDWYIWQLLLGANQPNGRWFGVLAGLLVLYNILRFVLTKYVGPLREEEERSGYSPKYGHWFQSLYLYPQTYGWLALLHQINWWLMYVALLSFALHAAFWMSLKVYLPAN